MEETNDKEQKDNDISNSIENMDIDDLNEETKKKAPKNVVKYSTEIDEPPQVVVIQGGKGSGKTTLIKSLVKYYTNQNITKVQGSITVKTNKNKRITFYECTNDISSLIDLSKIADVAIVLIDARVGFEMDTFEFISLLKNHGFTNIAGIITHMDGYKQNKSLGKYKKQIKKRFLKDATEHAKLFYLFGVKNNLYIKTQLHTLGRYLKVVKSNTPGFRLNHPYILSDRYEVTFIKSSSDDKEDDVLVSFYGYVRGNHFNKNSMVHLNGLGDYKIDYATTMGDPCPIEIVESKGKVKRTLKQKDKFLYAPFCNINNVEYDRKTGYIDIPEKLVTFTKGLKENDEYANDEGIKMVRQLQDSKGNIDKMFEEDAELELLHGVNIKDDDDDLQYRLNNKKRKLDDNIDSGINLKEININLQNILKKDKDDKILSNQLYKNNLSKEIVSNDDNQNTLIDKMTSNDTIIDDEKINIETDDIEDTYRFQTGFEKDEDYDLEFLLKNCKNKFITGGYTEMMDNEEEESEDSDNKQKKNKESNPPPKIQEISTKDKEKIQEEKDQLIKNQLKPFFDDNNTYGIFQLGSYIRVDIKTIKRKYAENFSPLHPIILATLSLQEHETQMGFMKIKFVKHLWYPKILKTNDPLILSIGWRKFQTTMAYCKEDKNRRLRLIKYTPKFTKCYAICYGPLMPINIAVVAIQNNYDDSCENFRICGTGDLIEVNQSFNLVKKLKLIGEPEEIYKKTAYIKNMFNSNLEVARYIGAKIQTVSGIRGTIKKQLNSKPEGRFRATFEDKILKSDIVFLKAWTQVELNKFYNPIITYQDSKMKYLRTMAQLRQDYGIELKQKADSEYKDIVREERVFPNLVISKNLEKSLPFKNKNKTEVQNSEDETFHLKKLGLPYKKKIKNYLTDNEKSVYSMLQRLQTLKNIKEKNIKKGEEKFKNEMKLKEEKEEKLKKKRLREKMIKKMLKKGKKDSDN